MGVVLEKLVIKILAGIEMTWWESKPGKTKKIKLKRTYNYTRAMLCFTMFQQEKRFFLRQNIKILHQIGCIEIVFLKVLCFMFLFS